MGRQAGKETLGERIARLRRAANMTQEELAGKAGEKLSSLRNWEGDHRTPGLWSALQLAKALGVSLEALAECAEPVKRTVPKGERKQRRRATGRPKGRPKGTGETASTTA